MAELPPRARAELMAELPPVTSKVEALRPVNPPLPNAPADGIISRRPPLTATPAVKLLPVLVSDNVPAPETDRPLPVPEIRLLITRVCPAVVTTIGTAVIPRLRLAPESMVLVPEAAELVMPVDPIDSVYG